MLKLILFWLSQTWPWNKCFLVALCHLIVRIPNLEVATKRLSPSAGKNTGVVLVPCSRMEVHPYSYFRWCGIFLRSLGVICYDRWVLSEGHKNYFKDWCLMNSQSTFLFFNLFKLNELWPYYQKHVNQIILNCTTLWSLAFYKYWRPSFEFCWLWIFPWIKLSWHSCCVRQTWMTQLILAISLWEVIFL